jgi:hypothetical protein
MSLTHTLPAIIRTNARRLALTGLFLSLAACKALTPDTPEQTIRTFYSHLDHGELGEARKLSYFPEAGGLFESLYMQRLRNEIERTATCGGVTQVEIPAVEGAGDLRQAAVRASYAKCPPMVQVIKLLRVNGQWQIQEFTTMTERDMRNRLNGTGHH